jgi:hypothetical protein
VQYIILYDNWSYSWRPKLSLCTVLVYWSQTGGNWMHFAQYNS